MLTISPFNFKQNVKYNQSFKGNENTRILLEKLDSDEFSQNGRPVIKKMAKDKRAKEMAFRRVVPIKTLYNGCKKKIRYATENAANKAKRIMESRRGKPFATYYCPLCNGFHLCDAIKKFTKNIPY